MYFTGLIELILMIASHRILLVEDDADDRYIMHLAFTEITYTDHVKVFNTGEDLLKYLHNLPDPALYPSLIVLDYNMPGMNGSEALMRLKMDEVLRDIPVAMYSTGMRSVEQKLQALGASYCFEKGQQIGDVYALTEKLKAIVEEKVIAAE